MIVLPFFINRVNSSFNKSEIALNNQLNKNQERYLTKAIN